MARILGPTLTGIYSLVLFIYYIGEILTNLGIKNLTVKYISQFSADEDKGNLQRVFAYAIKVKCILTIICSLSLIFASGYLAEFYSEQKLKWYIILVSIILIPEGIALIFQSAIQGLQEYKALAARALFTAPIHVILTIAVLKLQYGILGLVSVNLFMAFLDLVIYYLFVKRKIKFRLRFKTPFPKDFKKRLFKYNWQVAVIAIVDAIVWQKSEVFFLGKMSTQAEVAFYTLSYNLSSWTIGFLPNILYAVLFPRISEFYGMNDRNSIERIYLTSTRYLMILCVPILFIGIGLSKNLVSVIYGSSYMPMTLPLNILFIATCYTAVCGPTSLVIYAMERQDIILKVAIFTTFINIALDFMLIPKLGAIGAAIANSVAQIVSVTVCTVKLCRFLVAKFPINDLLRIIGCSTIALIVIYFITKMDNALLGLAAGAISGTILYLVCIVFAGVLRASDFDALYSIKTKIPFIMQKSFEKLVVFVQNHAVQDKI